MVPLTRRHRAQSPPPPPRGRRARRTPKGHPSLSNIARMASEAKRNICIRGAQSLGEVAARHIFEDFALLWRSAIFATLGRIWGQLRGAAIGGFCARDRQSRSSPRRRAPRALPEGRKGVDGRCIFPVRGWEPREACGVGTKTPYNHTGPPTAVRKAACRLRISLAHATISDSAGGLAPWRFLLNVQRHASTKKVAWNARLPRTASWRMIAAIGGLSAGKGPKSVAKVVRKSVPKPALCARIWEPKWAPPTPRKTMPLQIAELAAPIFVQIRTRSAR